MRITLLAALESFDHKVAFDPPELDYSVLLLGGLHAKIHSIVLYMISS